MAGFETVQIDYGCSTTGAEEIIGWVFVSMMNVWDESGAGCRYVCSLP